MRIVEPEPHEIAIARAQYQGRSLAEAISEVNRELTVRERIFPKWVKEGKMDAIDSQDRFDRLAAARHFLVLLAESTAVAAPVTSSGDMTAVA